MNDGLLKAVDFSDVTLDSSGLIKEARENGAVAIPAHPGRPRIGLCEFVDQGVEFADIGIVEVLNGGSRTGENERAFGLAQERSYKGIGGSDAHLVSSIGSCLTHFEGWIGSEPELVDALLSGEYTALRMEDTRPSDPQ